MWKVTIECPYGGEPSIYWVAADTAGEAETTARDQADGQINAQTPARVEHADAIDPAEEPWPRPRLVDGIRVFTFDDSGSAYDQTQVRADVHDGDVLHIPSENVVGFLMRAWPVAVSADRGVLHTLADPDDLVIDGIDYRPSVQVALGLLGTSEAPSPPEHPYSHETSSRPPDPGR